MNSERKPFLKLVIAGSLFVLVIAVFLTKGFLTNRNKSYESDGIDVDKQFDEELKEITPFEESKSASKIYYVGYSTDLSDILVSAKLEEKGFIAIFKVANNKDEELIGKSSLVVGETGQVSIKPEKPINYGDNLKIILYKDKGDGIFNSQSGYKPFEDVRGNAISESLIITTAE